MRTQFGVRKPQALVILQIPGRFNRGLAFQVGRRGAQYELVGCQWSCDQVAVSQLPDTEHRIKTLVYEVDGTVGQAHGTQGIRTLSIIDQAPSIYCHANWTEQQRLDAGAFTTSPERMINAYINRTPSNQLISGSRVVERAMALDSPYFHNAIILAQAVVKDDMAFTGRVLFDHTTNDWRDVIHAKINVPTAIFTGEYSDWLESQRWMNSVINDSVLFVYGKAEQGDHFLAFKNPEKFAADLRGFLDSH